LVAVYTHFTANKSSELGILYETAAPPATGSITTFVTTSGLPKLSLIGNCSFSEQENKNGSNNINLKYLVFISLS